MKPLSKFVARAQAVWEDWHVVQQVRASNSATVHAPPPPPAIAWSAPPHPGFIELNVDAAFPNDRMAIGIWHVSER